MQYVSLTAVLTLVAAVLTGCTAPKALQREELAKIGSAHQQALAPFPGGQSSAWSLERTLAWALEHNVDFRMSALEAAIATGNRKLASMDMLPKLTAEAGYRKRSNVLASTSKSIDTGQVSLVPSTSSERESTTASLEASWDVLDFGLAYFRAREYGQQALSADEQRRRVMHTVIRDIVHAWWKAHAYQQLKGELRETQRVLEEAIAQSEAILDQRLRSPVEVIEYRKALLLVLKRLDAVALELDQARDDLARLLHLPAGVEIEVTTQTYPAAVAVEGRLPEVDLQYWQLSALVNRPEMRQAIYESRRVDTQVRRRMLDFFPHLMFRYGTNYDGNELLTNNRWDEAGAQVSWNLIKLASIPGYRRDAKMNRKLAGMREEAQAAAILAQVAIARKAYRQNQRAWCMSQSLAELDNQRTQFLDARAATANLDRLSLIRAHVDNLLLRSEAAFQYAELQKARMTMLLSAGLLDLPAIPGDDAVDSDKKTDKSAAELQAEKDRKVEQAVGDWLTATANNAHLAELQAVARDFGIPEPAAASPAAPETSSRTCL